MVKNDLKYVFKFGYYHGIRAANQVSFHILQQKYFKTKYCQCYSDKQTAKVCKAQLTEHLQKKDFLSPEMFQVQPNLVDNVQKTVAVRYFIFYDGISRNLV